MYAIYFLILVFLSGIIQQSRCAFIDYDDIRDPFDFIWASRDPILSQPNKACYARLGSQLMEGVCMTDVHCALSKGQSRRNSTCGLLSNCCIYTGSCGDTTTSKVSYFVSNNNLPVGATCTNNVRLVNRNICQLKIDILSMTLQSPDAQGLCSTERFEVPNTNVPVICGENSNQHLYAHLNLMYTRQVGLTVTSQSANKQFVIKVTQLYCPRMTDLFNLRKNLPAMIRDYPMLAPDNCDQYYTAPLGTFKSIGYSGNSLIQSSYSRNLQYTICFKRLAETSECIRFSTNVAVTLTNAVLYVPFVTPDTAVTNGAITAIPIEPFYSVTPGPFYVYFESGPLEVLSLLGFEIGYDSSGTGCPA